MFFKNTTTGKNEWWRYLLFITFVIISIGVGQLPMIIGFYFQKEKLGLSDKEFQEIWDTANFDKLQMDENLMLVLMLLPFALAFLIMIPLIKKLHKRLFTTLLTGRREFDWKRVFVGFSVWFVLATILIFIFLPLDEYFYQFNLSTFIPLFIISIILIPLQASFEEVFFRGYLMQGFYLLSKNKIVPILLTTLIFGLMHTANPELQYDFKLILAYIFLSFMWTLITVLDDGLELPIGIHTGNNIFVALVMSTSDGAMKTQSIFRTDVSSLTHIFPLVLPLLVLFTFGILFLKYKWRISYLFKKPTESNYTY